ncbi:MAG: IS256 family transposase [bacterium]
MQAPLIKSVPQAMRTMKALGDERIFSDSIFLQESREAVAEVLHGRMVARISAHLEHCKERGIEDRRNGSYKRRLLMGAGDLELKIPRTRTYDPVEILERYSRRAPQVEAPILAAFVLGLSTRKVGKALLQFLGESVNSATVSKEAKQLDAEVASYQRSKLEDRYRVLMFDGVVLSRKTGAGAIRRPVLVALGIRPDGNKEVIDFRLGAGESQNAWEAFLNDLYNRGLEGNQVELIVSDGGAGLLAALPLVFPHLPVQRCWAHKMRNALDKCRKVDREAMKNDLRKIMNAPNHTKSRSAAGLFAKNRDKDYPEAVVCLAGGMDALLAHYIFTEQKWRQASRSTNVIERYFVEVRRRTRPMGVMADRASKSRILYAVFTGINQSQGTATPFPMTDNS